MFYKHFFPENRLAIWYAMCHFYLLVFRGQIKGYNSSKTGIMCEAGSYKPVIG